MPDFEKIKKNYSSPEVTANFFVLYKDEETWINGWISMEPSLEEFISIVQEEIEYSWELGHIDIQEYLFFHIDLNDKNHLKEIKDDNYYQFIKRLDEIYIVILHKDIKYRIIENIPPLFEWLMGTL